MPVPGMTRDPKILEACAAVDAAVQALREVQAAVQRDCPHSVVAENANQVGNYRICLACGVEEEGSHWSGGSVWSRVRFDREPVLGNTADRLTVTPKQAGVGNFWALRIPHIGLIRA